jgi:hypothetical protein
MEDENNKMKREEILNKILEIQKKEDELKKRKHILQKQKPWYTQAPNIIGLLTIIITVGIAVFSFISNEEKIVLECVYSAGEPFTNISPNITTKVKVLYEDAPTENIGKVKFKLTNKGTKAIKKSDFEDGPIEFVLKGVSQPNLNDTIVAIPLLLDVIKLKNAGQKNDLIKINSKDEVAKFTYLPSLINPNETVELEALLSNINTTNITINGNIADGTFTVVKQYEEEKKSNFLTLGQSIIDILGAKWIALIILIVFFLLSLLKSLAAFDGFDKSLIDYTFGTLFITIDLSFLAMIISVIMN